jgi:hypothetical protein
VKLALPVLLVDLHHTDLVALDVSEHVDAPYLVQRPQHLLHGVADLARRRAAPHGKPADATKLKIDGECTDHAAFPPWRIQAMTSPQMKRGHGEPKA